MSLHFSLQKFQMFFQLYYRHQEKIFVVVQIIAFVLLVEELGFFGVMEMVLSFSSVISVIGLEKLSTLGLDGNGAIFGSLFLNGETLPSGNKKLFSLDGPIGGRFFDKICFDEGGKS